MRVLIVAVGTVFVTFISFLIIKFWGQSLTYTEYKHPMLTQPSQLIFNKLDLSNFEAELNQKQNIYLDVLTTLDQKLVVLKTEKQKFTKPLVSSNYEEVKDQVFLIENYKEILKTKNLFLNINENRQALHEIFLYGIQQMGFGNGQNIIVTSPYESVLRALKEKAPELVYATTQPEILKIVAMDSMGLISAATIRADVIFFPLKINGQNFYTESLLSEFKKRYKKMIIGPIDRSQLDEAQKLNPYGIILSN